MQDKNISKLILIEDTCEALGSKFKKKKVLVIGDSIIDEYIGTQPVGMSQEDPTIVVTTLDNKLFIGGASIVAAHASSLGANSKIITIAGQDKSMKFLTKELKKTEQALNKVFPVIKKAINNGVHEYLDGDVIKPVFRKFN